MATRTPEQIADALATRKLTLHRIPVALVSRLREIARAEHRSPEDQAAYFLERAVLEYGSEPDRCPEASGH